MKRFFQKLAISDRNLHDLLTNAGLALVLRAGGAVCAFALNIVIGRLLGPAGAGLYFLALSVVTITAIIARLGMDHALLRFISTSAAENDWAAVKSVYAYATRIVMVVGLGLSLVILATAAPIVDFFFKDSDLAWPLRCMAFGVLFFGLMMVISEALKGLSHFGSAMLVSGVIYPVVALVFVWPLVYVFGTSGAALAYVLGTATAVVYGAWTWRQAMRKHLETSVCQTARLWISARKLWVMAVVNSAIIPWMPLLLLGIWGSAEEAGVFGAALRLSTLMSFFLAAVNTVVAPKFAQLQAKGDIGELCRVACRFALVISVAASPIFIFLIFWSDLAMSAFGPDFTVGHTALTILVLGQAINTITGSVGYILMISGHETDIRNTALLSAGLMLACAIAFIPSFGIDGAAFASFAAVTSMTLLNGLYVYRRLGIFVFPK